MTAVRHPQASLTTTSKTDAQLRGRAGRLRHRWGQGVQEACELGLGPGQHGYNVYEFERSHVARGPRRDRSRSRVET